MVIVACSTERWDLMQEFARPERPDIAERTRKTWGVWMILGGIAAALSWIPLLLIALTLDPTVNPEKYAIVEAVVYVCLCVSVLIGGLTIGAGYNLLRGRNPWFVYAMCIVGMLPLTLAAPLTLGIGLQVLLLLSVRAVRDQFDSAAPPTPLAAAS